MATNDLTIGACKIPAHTVVGRLSCEISIVGIKKIKFRIWLSSFVFKFAAFVAGTKSKIDIEIKNEE